jgi:hypothetical protein
MFGFIAVSALVHYFCTKGEKAKKHEYPNFITIGDFTLTWEEIDFHRNELDEIEIRIQEIEDDLRIRDDISHLREMAYKYELQRLEDAKDRHNLRLDEIDY